MDVNEHQGIYLHLKILVRNDMDVNEHYTSGIYLTSNHLH